MTKRLEQIARRIDAAVPLKKNQWSRSALVPWRVINELREELARIDAERAKRANAGVMAAPTPKPVAMIDAADARRLADELEKLRCDHWTHWSAQENHVAATAVRHLRLLAEHNAPGVTAAPAPHIDPFTEHFAKAEAEQVHSWDAGGVLGTLNKQESKHG